jgi:RNA polymerase sigma factor (sigma-70 family)
MMGGLQRTAMSRIDSSHSAKASASSSAVTTGELIARIRRGEPDAAGALYERYFDALRRWARGRMPHWVRNAVDTVDIVQDTLLRTLQRIDRFEHQGEGSLRKYLRTAVDNRIKDEHRRVTRHGPPAELDERKSDEAPSPLERAIASETETRYHAALARLKPSDRRLVVGRVELGYSPQQLAAITGRRSADSARIALHRALARLAKEMTHGAAGNTR